MINELTPDHLEILTYLHRHGITDRHHIRTNFNDTTIQTILTDLFRGELIVLEKDRVWIIQKGIAIIEDSKLNSKPESKAKNKIIHELSLNDI
jgi:hypothetical protein